MLIGKFWGTSDAQGIPGAFCRCPVCEEARKLGGESVRLRSCFRLSDKIMLDLGADAVIQAMRYGPLSELEHVLITHTHEDHLNVHMIMELVWGGQSRKTPLHYYLTDKAFDIIEHWRKEPWVIKGSVPYWEDKGLVAFHRLEFGKRTKIGDITVTPFRGNHRGNMGEDAALYLIELPDGRNLFYGLDSSVYYPETLKALSDRHIDIFISEATSGIKKESSPQHMRLSDVYELINTLYSQKTLDKNSTVYLTHINHSTSHSVMLREVERLNFPVKTVVAYDGLEIL